MKRRTQLLFSRMTLAMVLIATMACDRTPVVKVVVPATRPAAAATTNRPTTRPASRVTINDQVFSFPPAKMVMQQGAAGVIVTLFSDDPPTAAREDYRGNSYRFEATFEVASIDELSGQTFTWKDSGDEQRDSLNGIFLNGQRQTVQPLAATLTLLKTGDQWTASIGGEFTYVDNQAADQASVKIHAFADLAADLAAPATKP